MIKITLTILLILINSIYIQAQSNILTSDNTSVWAIADNYGDLMYEQVKGTPYTDTLQEAVLRGQDSTVYLVRYDAYKGLIEYKEKGKDEGLKALSPDTFCRFDFVNKKQSYTTLIYSSIIGFEKGFGLITWNNGEGVELIKRETIKFKRGTQSHGGYGPNIADSFTAVEVDYYIRLQENGQVVKIPERKKEFAHFLGKSIEKKVKKEKLNPKKEQDLIKLLTWKYAKQ